MLSSVPLVLINNKSTFQIEYGNGFSLPVSSKMRQLPIEHFHRRFVALEKPEIRELPVIPEVPTSPSL